MISPRCAESCSGVGLSAVESTGCDHILIYVAGEAERAVNAADGSTSLRSQTIHCRINALQFHNGDVECRSSLLHGYPSRIVACKICGVYVPYKCCSAGDNLSAGDLGIPRMSNQYQVHA